MENEHRERVAKYIDQELSTQEIQEFEEQLKIDKKLSAELDLQLDAIAILRASEKVKLKEEMNTWWSEVASEPSTTQETPSNNKVISIQSKKYLYLAAAAILILLSVAYLYFASNTDKISADTLVAQYLSEPTPLSSDSRTVTSSTDSLRTIAQKHYNSKEFAESIALFTQITNTPNTTFLDHLYLGLSQLYLPNQTDFSPAITHLQEVLKTDNDFHQKAHWFLALAHYKNGNIAESQKILKQIASDSTGDYADKARELLSKLKGK